MEIKFVDSLKENKIRYKIMGQRHALNYRTTENKVLKKFLKNDYYKNILCLHGGDFLSYLKEIGKLRNKALTVPDTVYVGQGDVVASYTREFIFGNSISELYPKTTVEELEKAIREFYQYVEMLPPDFRIDGITPKDIIYTGESLSIKNLDQSYFDGFYNVEINKAYLDLVIFVGLFGFDPTGNMSVSDDIQLLSTDFKESEMNVLDYIDECKKYLALKGESSKYLRSLRSGIYYQ